MGFCRWINLLINIIALDKYPLQSSQYQFNIG